jgi:pimeloyl-ACP methyl ester carboxylesterase
MFIPQERYIKIGSINTRYMAEGEGSPVVLVHGIGGSASGWLPLFPLHSVNWPLRACPMRTSK